MDSHDFSVHTVKAIKQDIRKFACFCVDANNEPYDSKRCTVLDVRCLKKHLRENKGQSVATVNRALVSIRRYFDWLVAQEYINVNPAQAVKELCRQQLAPQGLERSQVRKLFREIELIFGRKLGETINKGLHRFGIVVGSKHRVKEISSYCCAYFRGDVSESS